jgi:hypothetical protein
MKRPHLAATIPPSVIPVEVYIEGDIQGDIREVCAELESRVESELHLVPPHISKAKCILRINLFDTFSVFRWQTASRVNSGA